VAVLEGGVLFDDRLAEEDLFVETHHDPEELELAILVGVVVVVVVDDGHEHHVGLDVGLLQFDVGLLLEVLLDVLVIQLPAGALVVRNQRAVRAHEELLLRLRFQHGAEVVLHPD